MVIPDFVPPIVGAAVGVFLGVLYFSSLRGSIVRYLQSGGVAQALLGAGFRMAAAGAVFWLLAQWNAMALMAGLGGFLLARYRAQKQQVKANA